MSRSLSRCPSRWARRSDASGTRPGCAGCRRPCAGSWLAGKTAAELRKHARRILTRLDPEGAEQRAREARAGADVTFEGGEEGMSAVIAQLPVEDGRMVKEAVDACAIRAKQSGDVRPIGVLRGKALTGWASEYLTGRSPMVSGAAPRSGGRPIEVGIVVGLQTALGHDALPPEVPGAGIVPREVVAEQVAQVRATWVTSAGPGSQVFANRCDVDHAVPYPEGPTSVDNLLPPDRTWHVAKTRTALGVTMNPDGSATWNSALGQSRTVTPYDYMLPSPSGPSGQAGQAELAPHARFVVYLPGFDDLSRGEAEDDDLVDGA